MVSRSYRRLCCTLIVAVLCFSACALSASLSGAALDSAIAAQSLPFQDTLRSELQGISGCFVTGPLGGVANDSLRGYSYIRVVCPDIQTLERALERLEKSAIVHVRAVARYTEHPAAFGPRGFRGVEVSLLDGRTIGAFTFQQLRFLIWARGNLSIDNEDDPDSVGAYADAVSHYLYMIDMLEHNTTSPRASAFALSPERDLYPPVPPYIIEGYQNYKDFMQAHAGIYTEFASGVLGFVPTDSLMIMLKQKAPQEAYPNKEAARFQDEMKEFFGRDGDVRMLTTLTKEVFDTLHPGEYFFAVGLNGTVRFGRELLREEVQQIEKSTGHKVARANHAFLFPGEPLLTAGAFFVGDTTGGQRLRAVNAQSGHYFYSNIAPTIREDIMTNSNNYLLTLGHLFVALDALGIPYDSVVISKF